MAQVEQNTTIALPEEMWEKVLSKLWLKDDDEYEKDILNCLQVCSIWETLIDQMPPKYCWNPWILSRFPPFSSSLYAFSTILSSNYVTNHVLHADYTTDRNPFRNHTLGVFFLHPYEEKIVLDIIKAHGRHIQKFIYSAWYPYRNAFNILHQMLSNMQNIQILYLDLRFFLHEDVTEYGELDVPKDWNKLVELVLAKPYILNRNEINVADDYTIYSKFLDMYSSQITRLTVTNLYLHSKYTSIIDQFPNIRDLKIMWFTVRCSDVTQEESPPENKVWPKVTRLALKQDRGVDRIAIEHALKFIACFAKTLKLLSVSVNFEKITPVSAKHGVEDPSIYIATFTKLTHLILTLSLVYHKGNLAYISLEKSIKFLLPNLISIAFDDTEKQFENKEISKREMQGICAPLWSLVPSSVEKISLRILEDYSTPYQQFSVIYKCRRNDAV